MYHYISYHRSSKFWYLFLWLYYDLFIDRPGSESIQSMGWVNEGIEQNQFKPDFNKLHYDFRLIDWFST